MSPKMKCMGRLLRGGIFALAVVVAQGGLVGAANAGQPFTLYDPTNTFAAPVDANGVHVVCTGCSGGSGGPIVPTSVTNGITAATVGTSSAQALAAGTRISLNIQNVSATASVGCRPDGGTAALNTAGTYMIGPLGGITWGPVTVPAGAVNCIASVASTPVTIEAH